MLTFTHVIERGHFQIRFNEKPDVHIRSILKANGFRWSPASGVWWRSKVSGAADFLAALDRRISPKKPDGQCWVCGESNGYFRNEGAAAPVRCDECQKAVLEQRNAQTNKHRAQDDPMGVDRLYEDSCREQCGL